MKNTIIRSSILLILFFIGIIACQKQEVSDITVEVIDNEFLVITKNQVAKIHNEYLDFIYDNTFSPKKTIQPSVVDLSVLFFNNYYSPNMSSEFCVNSCNTFNQKTINGAIDFDKIVLNETLSPYINQIKTWILEPQSLPIFIEKTDNILFSLTLDKNTKLELACIVGIVQGSYAYWNDSKNINKWTRGKYFTEQLKKQIILTSLGGANQGAVIGVLQGEITTNPRTVIGGATYSCLAILANTIKYSVIRLKQDKKNP